MISEIEDPFVWLRLDGILFPKINPNIYRKYMNVWKYFIYIYSIIHSDIKKLLYKYMRCREEDRNSRDDCECGEYYQTKPELTMFYDFMMGNAVLMHTMHILQ